MLAEATPLVSRRRRSTWRWSIRAWAPRGKIVYARIGAQHFIAPDNGLLSRLALATPPSTIITVTEPEFWLPRGFGDVSRPRHHGAGGGPAEPGARAGATWARRNTSSCSSTGRRLA